MNLRVVRFRNQHQPMVDVLLHEISAEFVLPITSQASVRMKQVAHVMGNQFWVALDNQQLVGTIGLMRLKDYNACLKSMFVAKDYRSKGVANLLLKTLLDYCKKKSVQHVYLGTMSQMKAAQSFYEKNGFLKVEGKLCPPDFNNNPLDDVFYQLEVMTRV
jgi:N-acetylglutamate synthase-like GNAT family acetyltransferase